MKLLLFAILSLSLHVAHADQGDACVEVFVNHKSSWSKARLSEWCVKHEINAAHAEAADYFSKIPDMNWDLGELMIWARDEKLTSAHVSCGIMYDELGATIDGKSKRTMTAELLKYCRDHNVTKKEIACVRRGKTDSVEKMNRRLAKCQKK